MSYLPLSWGSVLLILEYLVNKGKWNLGLAVVLSLVGLLRVSDMMGLLVRDVTILGRRVILRLRDTKTGPNQPVVFEDGAIASSALLQ